MLSMSAKLQQNSSSHFPEKFEIRKQVPQQEQQQQKSGVSYRAATKVAANNSVIPYFTVDSSAT